MPALHECPKCGALMELEPYDPSVGIMSSFWFCIQCETTELADEDTSDYLDNAR